MLRFQNMYCAPPPRRKRGDYNAYLVAFDLRVQEMNMKQENNGMTMEGI